MLSRAELCRARTNRILRLPTEPLGMCQVGRRSPRPLATAPPAGSLLLESLGVVHKQRPISRGQGALTTRRRQ